MGIIVSMIVLLIPGTVHGQQAGCSFYKSQRSYHVNFTSSTKKIEENIGKYATGFIYTGIANA